MVSKIIALVALILLPLSVTFWYRSHAHPVRYRFDVTLYKSLDVYLKNGVCGLHLLSMPTKTASKSEFETALRYNATPNQASFFLSSTQQGPFRFTWLVFPSPTNKMLKRFYVHSPKYKYLLIKIPCYILRIFGILCVN